MLHACTALRKRNAEAIDAPQPVAKRVDGYYEQLTRLCDALLNRAPLSAPPLGDLQRDHIAALAGSVAAQKHMQHLPWLVTMRCALMRTRGTALPLLRYCLDQPHTAEALQQATLAVASTRLITTCHKLAHDAASAAEHEGASPSPPMLPARVGKLVAELDDTSEQRKLWAGRLVAALSNNDAALALDTMMAQLHAGHTIKARRIARWLTPEHRRRCPGIEALHGSLRGRDPICGSWLTAALLRLELADYSYAGELVVQRLSDWCTLYRQAEHVLHGKAGMARGDQALWLQALHSVLFEPAQAWRPLPAELPLQPRQAADSSLVGHENSLRPQLQQLLEACGDCS
jgi:hypothetical protein